MQTNLQNLHAIYTAFAQGDIQTILSHLSDDVKWEAWDDNSAQKAGVPWLKAGQGKAGAGDFFGVVATQMQMTDFQTLNFMVGENQIAVEIIVEANIPATGGHFRDEEIHLWTFNEEGKVNRLRHYADTFKHMKAAGKV